MEKEDTVSVQWAQEDVETSYSLINNNKGAVSCKGRTIVATDLTNRNCWMDERVWRVDGMIQTWGHRREWKQNRSQSHFVYHKS